MLFLWLIAFEIFGFSIDNSRVCNMCLYYGNVTLTLARSGAPLEEIQQKATAKCHSGEVPTGFQGFCASFVKYQLTNILKEAKTTTKTAQQYCEEKKVC